jgi:orotate phosphoribosyltransferase-like protein
MKHADPSSTLTEVLHLRLEGLSVRRIACHLHLSRRAVRTLLGRHGAPVKPTAPRRSFVDPYERSIRTFLDDTPERRAPIEST